MLESLTDRKIEKIFNILQYLEKIIYTLHSGFSKHIILVPPLNINKIYILNIFFCFVFLNALLSLPLYILTHNDPRVASSNAEIDANYAKYKQGLNISKMYMEYKNKKPAFARKSKPMDGVESFQIQPNHESWCKTVLV